MRKIKFRAWQNSSKKMINPDEVSAYLINAFRFNGDEAGCTFMQYTGLNDKYGKEIYLGDILKTHFDKTSLYEEYDEVGVVKIPNLFYGAVIADEKRGVNYQYFMHSEVIGNIYENPELIS